MAETCNADGTGFFVERKLPDARGGNDRIYIAGKYLGAGWFLVQYRSGPEKKYEL